MKKRHKDVEYFNSEEGGLELLDDSGEVHFSEKGVPEYVDKKIRVFKAGTYRGKPYGSEFLDNMVKTFKKPEGERDWEVPMQVDHSDSAWDTVGHLREVFRAGDEVHGIARFIGSDVVQRVEDGRFKKSSVGVKIRPMVKIKEMSITPFPEVLESEIFSEGEEKVNEKEKKTQDQDAQEEVQMKKQTPKAQASEDEVYVKMREEFSARTAALEEKIRKQEEILRFKESQNFVLTFMEGGKIAPAVKEEELAFVQTLSPDQMELYRKKLEKSPAVVSFSVLSTAKVKAPVTGAPKDPTAEAEELFADLEYKKNDAGKYTRF